ncbi:MAG TPA: hypothetical protein VGB92_23090 [Longimicrobium sp.]
MELDTDLGALFMLAGMIAFLRLLPVLDGWGSLAARYRTAKGDGGEVFRFAWARARGVNLNVSVLVTPAGLGIRVWAPWHPPIFVPWSEMVYCKPAGLFSGSARLLCRHAESVPIYLFGRPGRAAVAAWVRNRTGTPSNGVTAPRRV